MKRCLRPALALAIGLLVCCAAHAQREDCPVTLYSTIEAIVAQQPDTVIIADAVVADTPFDVIIDGDSRATNRRIKNSAVACLGDTLWLANAQWIKRHLAGNTGPLDCWMPLYFTEKVAFVEYCDDELKYYTFYDTDGNVVDLPMVGDLYLLDVRAGRVIRLTEKTLRPLLARFPDLLMRYDALADRKDPIGIRFFFLQFVERLNDDPTVPRLDE